MRLLHVTHMYRPAIGGAERYITDLCEELARRGHRVDVFTSRALDYHAWESKLPRADCLDGVHVRRFRSLRRSTHTWRALEYGFRHYWQSGARRYEPFIFYGNGPLCPGLFVALLRAAPRYDLVHINHLHYSHAYTAYRAARLRGVPVVTTPHLHIEQRETHDVGYMWTVLRGSQAVVAVSPAEKEYLRRRGLACDITVGGNGLRLERYPALDPRASRARFGLPEDGFVILFLGRKTEYKGLEACLAAFAALRERRPDVYFLAIGPETDYSQRLWSEVKGLPGLIVRGAVEEEEKLAALAACDALALPSQGEAFGIVYLEGWAYRKPVIGANLGAVASFIRHGENGFLVQPGQVTPLVAYLEALADDPALGRALGERGRTLLESRYTVNRVADVFEGTCARVLRRLHTQRERTACSSA